MAYKLIYFLSEFLTDVFRIISSAKNKESSLADSTASFSLVSYPIRQVLAFVDLYDLWIYTLTDFG